ncbi:MAG: hypothetical protein CL416_05900 [Acidimicrobiaceae bacterium]|nr:hypothetical protein [Acidimicrobiaceae bacterium]
MEIGGDRYRTVGGVHRIPIDGVPGMLVLAGLEVVGPDAAALLGRVGAETMVCLQTDAEIDRRYPPYLEWLADPEPHEALRLPIEDHLVAPDGPMALLIEVVVDRVNRGSGVVVHCGAGWWRAGLVGALVLIAYGATVTEALDRVRAARPAAGPQSDEQDQQLVRLARVVNGQTTRR